MIPVCDDKNFVKQKYNPIIYKENTRLFLYKSVI